MIKGTLLSGMPSYLPYPPAPPIRRQFTGGTHVDTPEAKAELDLFDELKITHDRLGIGRYFIEHGGAKWCQSAQRCEREYRRHIRTEREEAERLTFNLVDFAERFLLWTEQGCPLKGADEIQ